MGSVLSRTSWPGSKRRKAKQELAVRATSDPTPRFGTTSMRKQFLFHPEHRNLNHGSFGTIPRDIQKKLREYQDLAEQRPDPFIRYEYPKLLDESRAAVADLLSAPVEGIVFVPNATSGVDTVLRNVIWDSDGKDVVLYFSTIYSGCGCCIDSVVDSGRGLVSSYRIDLSYPVEDVEVVSRFNQAVDELQSSGKRPKICIFDVVSSMPGVRFPFEMMTAACKDRGVQSLIDGAQGVGMVPLDLGSLDPDFFVSNCHKWLLVPRGCAVFYVAVRNQDMISSTLPTSHGYVSKSGKRYNPLPPSAKSAFINNFEFVGTLDSSPYLCVKDSIKWRRDVLGGEDEITRYLWTLARDGGQRVAEILGTWVMENKTGTLANCGMVNVALPLLIGNGAGDSPTSDDGDVPPGPGTPSIPAEDAFDATQWMLGTLMEEYKTFIVLYAYDGRWWTRLSAQVYLDMSDFEWAGETLKTVCEGAWAKYGTSKGK